MANIRLIRRRIKSVQSTAKITRAMEMIATSKMRRTQQRMMATRPYAEKMREVLAHLAAQPQLEGALHPLLQQREPPRKIAVIHITADRGLCGGLNANVNRRTGAFIARQGVPVTVVTVGRRGRGFMSRYSCELRAEFAGLGDRPALLDTTPIARVIIDDYTNGLVDQVFIVYAQFVTTMTQHPVVQQILPVEPAETGQGHVLEYIYEPSSAFVLAQLLPRYVEMQVYHAVLEAIASEQSARMVAMRNATDSAHDMIEQLTLTYNKARQELITEELLDIAGGIVGQRG